MRADTDLPPLAPVDPSEFEDLSQYRAFWRRTGAVFLDGAALLPLTWIDVYLWNHTTNPAVLVPWTIALGLAGVAYTVWFVARFGQTPGKYACGVKVTTPDGAAVSYRRAALRHAIPILIFPVTVAIQTMNLLADRPEGRALGDAFALFAWVGLAWALAELVTMLTNRRRRAIHDYIAGTVVVRTQRRSYANVLAAGLAALLALNAFYVVPNHPDRNALAAVGSAFPSMLESNLAKVAARFNAGAPKDVGNGVVIKRLAAEPGALLTWHFVASLEFTDEDARRLWIADARDREVPAVCAESAHRELLDQGAKYAFEYRSANEELVGRFEFDRKACR